MAGLLAAFLGAGIDYPGRAKHMKDVIAYLGRMSAHEVPARRHGRSL